MMRAVRVFLPYLKETKNRNRIIKINIKLSKEIKSVMFIRKYYNRIKIERKKIKHF